MINKPDGVSEIGNGEPAPDTVETHHESACLVVEQSQQQACYHTSHTHQGWSLGITWGGHGRESSCLTRRCGPDRNLKGGSGWRRERGVLHCIRSGRCQGNATPSSFLHDGYLGIYPYTSVELLLVPRLWDLFV